MMSFWTRLMTIALLMPLLSATACASDIADLEPGAGDEVAEMADDETSDDSEASEEEAEADADDASTESDRRGPGAGMGMHEQHMQDMMHEQMLSAAVDQGLLVEEDVAFFNEIHPIIEAYHPEGAGDEGSLPVEAKKSMQRGFAAMAVSEGTLSQEDADRFTRIHDILADSGLMDHEAGSGMADMMGVTESAEDEHMAEAPSGEEMDLKSIMVGLSEASNRINAGLWAGDFEAISAAASAIANHPLVSAEERNAIQQALGEDFADFGQGDHAVHEGGLALVEAAESQDMDAVLAAFTQLQQDCVACHTAFRDRLADRSR